MRTAESVTGNQVKETAITWATSRYELAIAIIERKGQTEISEDMTCFIDKMML